ncbi:Os05g0135450, partial [Oryza sativa Japonica Group]
HLHHGGGELDLEHLLDGGVELDDAGGPRAVEQRLVGVEHHPVLEHVLVVLVVKARRRHRVERHGGGVHLVVGRWRAPALELRRVRRVDGRVRPAGLAAEVVEAGGEGGAVGAADGVGAGEGDHVVGGEALALEAGDELGEAEGRGGDVVGEHLV